MSFERTERSVRRRARVIRWIVVAAVFLAVTAASFAHQYINGANKPVGVDALCPFGGVETLFSLLTGAGYIDKIVASSVVLLIGMILLALVLRRSFCGQVCPLGGVQELFGGMGRKLFRRRVTVPPVVDRVARLLKWAILVFFVVWTWQAASLVMRPYDPWAAWTHVTSEELWTELGIGVGVLIVSLLGSMIYDRFFCKYLCPTGAFLGLFSRASLLRLRRDADACVDCGACDKACPMNITVSEELTVRSVECISCNECVNACPAAGALQVETASGHAVEPLRVTALVVVLLAILIAGATVVDRFDWTMPSLAEALQRSGSSESETPKGNPTGITGTAPNGVEFDTSLIKGYMSMREISDASGIPAETFTETWGVPAEDLGRPMKDIKDEYGFSPDDVRVWVGEQLQ